MSIASPPVTAPSTTATSATSVRFPGGATADLLCLGEDWITLKIEGELDTFDKYAIIDVLTPFVLGGFRRFRIDAEGVTFIDAAALRAFARVRWFLRRDGGTLEIVGLEAVAARTWAWLTEPTGVADRSRAALPGGSPTSG
ncbi:MAG: STAS domain-containing protein [Acidimicrobiales bacterium]